MDIRDAPWWKGDGWYSITYDSVSYGEKNPSKRITGLRYFMDCDGRIYNMEYGDVKFRALNVVEAFGPYTMHEICEMVKKHFTNSKGSL